MKKGRIWASVLYPESLPKNYEEIIQKWGLPIALSPLHDKDIDPDGSIKKEHYHIIFYFDGPTTYNHVNDLCKELNGTIPIKLESLRGMYRYHIHIDNPDKYQYDDRDRKLYNGFDSKNADLLTENEIDKMTNELISFIEDNDILEYRDLLYILKENDMLILLKVAKKNTVLFNTYIKSKRHKLKEKY